MYTSSIILINFLLAIIFIGNISANIVPIKTSSSSEVLEINNVLPKQLLNSNHLSGLDFDESNIESNPPKHSSSGFWSYHPSDLFPMRRPPVGLLRKRPLNSFGIGKRFANPTTNEYNPYHPVPRSVAIKGKHRSEEAQSDQAVIVEEEEEQGQQYGDESDEYSGRRKRQSPGSYLLLKLSRLNRVAPTKPKDQDFNKYTTNERDTNRSTNY